MGVTMAGNATWTDDHMSAGPGSGAEVVERLKAVHANQLRLWFASMAYVLMSALRRIGLAATDFARATCGTIRLKLLKIGALVTVSVRRVRIAMASAHPWQREWAIAHDRLCAASA